MMFSSEKMNPLKIDVVLDVLFKKMQIEDLNKCRLVCHQWNSRICEILKKSWQDLRIISLCTKSDAKKFNNEMLESTCNGIFGGFFLNVENCIIKLKREFFEENKPKFVILGLGKYCNDNGVDIYDLSTVLWYSASYLRELHIDYDCEFISRKNEINRIKVKNLINFEFPCLKKIKIKVPDYRIYSTSDKSKRIALAIFQEICKKSPKLGSISFKNASQLQSNVKDIIMNSLPSLQNLEELKITFELLSNHYRESESLGIIPVGLANLLEMGKYGLKLKYLTLTFKQCTYKLSNKQDNCQNLTRFLHTQAQDLEVLKLQLSVYEKPEITSESGDFKINLPNFGKLKKLTLGKNKCYRSWSYQEKYQKYIPYNTIDIQQKFPVLKEICLKFDGDTNWIELFSGSLETVTIVRVQCPYTGHDVKVKNYQPLEMIFPNVNKFQVDHLNDIINNSEEKNPWEETLEIFVISDICWDSFDEIDFVIFENFKVLQRLEILAHTSISRDSDECLNFNLESFNKLNLKSLKIHNFKISDQVVEKIHKKCIFDYRPDRFFEETDTSDDSESD